MKSIQEKSAISDRSFTWGKGVCVYEGFLYCYKIRHLGKQYGGGFSFPPVVSRRVLAAGLLKMRKEIIDMRRVIGRVSE